MRWIVQVCRYTIWQTALRHHTATHCKNVKLQLEKLNHATNTMRRCRCTAAVIDSVKLALILVKN